MDRHAPRRRDGGAPTVVDALLRVVRSRELTGAVATQQVVERVLAEAV